MGVHPNIRHNAFPKQGGYLGKRVTVMFNYDKVNTVEGTVVRDDVGEESGNIEIIRLDDGRYVLTTECQYSLSTKPVPPLVILEGDISEEKIEEIKTAFNEMNSQSMSFVNSGSESGYNGHGVHITPTLEEAENPFDVEEVKFKNWMEELKQNAYTRNPRDYKEGNQWVDEYFKKTYYDKGFTPYDAWTDYTTMVQ